MTSRRSARRELLRRRGLAIGIAAAVVAVLLLAGGYGVYRAQHGSDDLAVPAGATPTGVVVGQAGAPATIDVYLDFHCPACKTFEERADATIDELVATGEAKVVYHPVAYLDRLSSTRYTSRAAQASGCAADAGVFPAYLDLLFAEQPPADGAGLSDERLVALGQQAGAGDGFAPCVRDGRYAAWTRSVTAAATQAGVTSTPTVLVNGTAVPRTADALRAAVAVAG